MRPASPLLARALCAHQAARLGVVGVTWRCAPPSRDEEIEAAWRIEIRRPRIIKAISGEKYRRGYSIVVGDNGLGGNLRMPYREITRLAKLPASPKEIVKIAGDSACRASNMSAWRGAMADA